MLSEGEILDIMRELMWVCLKVAGPVLIISIIVGLVIAVFQAATQIHEQTLTFVPKVLTIGLVLLLMGSWIYNNISAFVFRVFELMAGVGS